MPTTTSSASSGSSLSDHPPRPRTFGALRGQFAALPPPCVHSHAASSSWPLLWPLRTPTACARGGAGSRRRPSASPHCPCEAPAPGRELGPLLVSGGLAASAFGLAASPFVGAGSRRRPLASPHCPCEAPAPGRELGPLLVSGGLAASAFGLAASPFGGAGSRRRPLASPHCPRGSGPGEGAGASSRFGGARGFGLRPCRLAPRRCGLAASAFGLAAWPFGGVGSRLGGLGFGFRGGRGAWACGGWGIGRGRWGRTLGPSGPYGVGG